MRALIETSTGDLLAVGEVDFTTTGFYDEDLHTIRDDPPQPAYPRDSLIKILDPEDPNYLKYHCWNGKAWVFVEKEG